MLKAILFFSGFILGGLSVVIFTEMRIEKIRPFITRGATEIAINHAIKICKNEFEKNEKLYVRKMRAKEYALKKYTQKLHEILDE